MSSKWTARQIYLGENLSQSDFFNKIKNLEKQAQGLSTHYTRNSTHAHNTLNKYMKQRQDMLENLLTFRAP